jgi:hypothetical protein
MHYFTIVFQNTLQHKEEDKKNIKKEAATELGY